MPITDLLERNAKLYGEEVCLVEINPVLDPNERMPWSEFALVQATAKNCHRREMTWNQFEDLANRTANLLIAHGVKPGDKVAILLMNCMEWLPVYFGALRAGALAVPLNFRYTADEIRYCLELSDATTLIYGPEFYGRVDAIKKEIPQVTRKFYIGDDCPDIALPYCDLVTACSGTPTGIQLVDEGHAAIYFSSGTTGFPKAILHSHASLLAACVTEQAHHGQSRDDIFLCIPPLYHTGAKMHWFGSLLAGSKAVLLRGVAPKLIMDALSDEKITIVWLLVPWAQDILDAIDSGEVNLADYDLERLRMMHIGAQPVPPSLVKRWKDIFPHHAYDTNYGLSESSGPGAVHLGVENEHKVGAIGIAGHGWQTKIIGEDGAEVAFGGVGELCLKGPGVMLEYYRDPAATAATLRDGWLLTGDMAMQDEDGFIFLVDRKKDVIITGGENIYPVQIEDFMRGHGDIKDVAVIGLPHQRLGEIAAAIVELKAGSSCTEEQIVQFCEALPRYKRPRTIILDTVPRNPTGKIEKPKLREKYCGDGLIKVQIEKVEADVAKR